MGERTGKEPNIPGIVNGIPKFTFTIPVFLPRGFPKEKMTDDYLEKYVHEIVESLVSTRIGEVENDIDYKVEPTIFGAGDFIVNITVSKHPDREYPVDYYDAILHAVRDISYVSGLHGFRMAKKFLIQNHAVSVPLPLKEAA